MELRVLGCSGGEAEGQRLTGLLVDGVVALDAGCLTQALTIPEQAAIRHIFLTHSHLDHICTLPFYTKNVFGHIQAPVAIHALPETLDALRRHLFNDELWPDFSVIPSPDNPIIRYEELRPFEPISVEGLRLTPIPVNHLVPCVGYLVEGPGASFLFTSDTERTDDVYRVANAQTDLRLFITEVSFPDAQGWLAEAARHLTPMMLGGELQKLERQVPVGIYHLTPGDAGIIVPQLEALGDDRVFLLKQDQRFRW